MQNFQQNLQKLEAADTQVLGVSMDSTFSNAAWADKIAVTFPLLSDWGGMSPASTVFTIPSTKQLAASTTLSTRAVKSKKCKSTTMPSTQRKS